MVSVDEGLNEGGKMVCASEGLREGDNIMVSVGEEINGGENEGATVPFESDSIRGVKLGEFVLGKTFTNRATLSSQSVLCTRLEMKFLVFWRYDNVPNIRCEK